MKVLSVGWTTFQETGKYTCATAEYFSLFSYSLLKRGGNLVTHGVCKLTSPVAAVISRPFGLVKKKSLLSFRKKKHSKKIEILERKLFDIEKRLALIEKHGVAAGAGAGYRKKAKELTEDRRLVLKEILEETKSLKENGE